MYVPGEVVVGQVEFRHVTKDRNQADEALIVQLTVAQVKNTHTTKVSVSKDLPCDLVNPLDQPW